MQENNPEQVETVVKYVRAKASAEVKYKSMTHSFTSEFNEYCIAGDCSKWSAEGTYYTLTMVDGRL